MLSVHRLSTQVVSENSNLLAPLAVDCVLKIMDQKSDKSVDLNNVRVVKKLGMHLHAITAMLLLG